MLKGLLPKCTRHPNQFQNTSELAYRHIAIITLSMLMLKIALKLSRPTTTIFCIWVSYDIQNGLDYGKPTLLATNSSGISLPKVAFKFRSHVVLR